MLHTLSDLEVGGGQVGTLTTAERVDRERVEIHVCYFLPGHELAASFRDAGLHPICLHHGPGRAAPTLVRLCRLIREREIDIVHTHGFPDRIFAQPAALLCRVPVVHTIHGTDDYSQDPRRRATLWGRARITTRHWLRRQLERLAVKRFIAVSQAVYDLYGSVVPDPERRLRLLVNGIPAGDFDRPQDRAAAAVLRREMGLEDSFPILINVARMSIATKDHLTLLRATALVRERHPKTTLLIVGDGRDRPIVEEEIARTGLSQAVRLLGERRDVAALLALSDVFVLPSRIEGISRAALEAMAAGKPVVASRIDAFTELVEDGETGYLAEPGDAQAFAVAISKIAEDRALAHAMGTRGRRIALERYDVSRVARGWEEIYAEILAR